MKTSDLINLRVEAEKKLCALTATEPGERLPEELLFEFRVHQIELEMQNEELRRTQAKLEESHNRYVDLYDNAPVAYLSLSDDGLITEINHAAVELLGIERKDMFSKVFATLVAPDDSDRWYLFCRQLTNNQRMNIELSMHAGNDIELSVQLNCLKVDAQLRITLTDLTQTKLLESIATAAALKQAQLLTEKTLLTKIQKEAFSCLEKISGQLPGVVYQFQLNTDGSYCFPYLSEGIRNLFPLSSQQVIQDASKIFAFVHPDDQEGLWASIQDSAKNLTPWRHEYRIKLDDGTINWLCGNSLAQRETDGSTLWNGFISDITERKKMEIALRESEFVCKFAIEGSGDGLWDRNLQTDEIKYSKLWKEMLGYTEDDILPNRQEWLTRVHPEDKQRVDFAMEAYLKGDTENYAIEYRIRSKDDSYLWILARGMVVKHGEDGTPLRMIGMHTDISKIKYQEQQSKEHLEQLAHVTRLGLMGEMASGIAHEVNQPLCAVTTYAQVIANLIKKEPLDVLKLSEITAKIQEQALRAGKIVHRMKNFCKSKVNARSTADINALIGNCVDLCHADLVKNNVYVIMELDDSLPFIHVDQLQIEQVLINLIRNSSDAFQDMPLENRRQLILRSFLSFNNTLSVSLQDNGCGIALAQQENIMTPFYTTKSEGMGMGLSICRSLLEAHEGTLFFKSIVGQGTTFFLTLPLSADSFSDK